LEGLLKWGIISAFERPDGRRRVDMNVTTERLEDCQVNVFIEMDAADIEKELRQTARKLSRSYNIPGYRRGKAPYHAVVRVFGKEVIQQQFLEDRSQEFYEKALEQVDFEPYQVGELQDVEWDPFRMTVLLPIEPELELGDYRAVRVPYGPEPVTDADVEARLAEFQDELSQWVPVERPAAMGDQVVLDFEGKVGDKLVMSNEGHEMVLGIEPQAPMPGFHDEIAGMSAGDEKRFTLVVPDEDYEQDVAGQEAEVTVVLHTIRKEDRPPLDDDLAMMVGDYESLEHLRQAIREEMETRALQQAEEEYLDKVLEAVLEAAERIEYPPQAVERELDLIMDRMERSLASSGMELDTYLQLVGQTRETYRQDLRDSAEDRLRKRLVLKEVARQESLEAGSEDVDAEIERVLETMGDDAEGMREVLDSPAGRESLASDLVMARAQELMTKIGKGEATVPGGGTDEVEPDEKSQVEGVSEASVAAEDPAGEATADQLGAEGKVAARELDETEEAGSAGEEG
jgi:trigger factor